MYIGKFKLLSVLLGTTQLTMGMNIAAWVFGSFSLVVNIGLKHIPMRIFEKIPVPDLESDKDSKAA